MRCRLIGKYSPSAQHEKIPRSDRNGGQSETCELIRRWDWSFTDFGGYQANHHQPSSLHQCSQRSWWKHHDYEALFILTALLTRSQQPKVEQLEEHLENTCKYYEVSIMISKCNTVWWCSTGVSVLQHWVSNEFGIGSVLHLRQPG